MLNQRNNRPLGIYGETIATNYLRSSGFKILERNFKKGYGEIDIICQEKDTLVFIEVKTRRTDTFGSPTEAITARKLKSLIRQAHFYKMLHPELPDDLRIDLLSLKLTSSNKIETIELFRNIT